MVLGDKSFIGGKLTTDSRELHSSYSLEENKKGFSGSIGSSGFSIGYGKTESKLKEKDLTNAKSNLVLGDGTTLNKGADITATNLSVRIKSQTLDRAKQGVESFKQMKLGRYSFIY